MSKYMKKIIFSAIGLLVLSSLALADDDRHITVDRQMGGMEQGSRIQAPGSFSGKPGSGTTPLSNIHQTISSHQGSERKPVDSSKSSISGNHGFVYTGETNHSNNVGPGANGSVEPVNNPVDTGAGTGGTGAGETVTKETNHPIDTGTSESPTEPVNNPIDTGAGIGGTGTGQTVTKETNHPIDTGTSESPTEPVNNPIDTGAGIGGTGTGETSTESKGIEPGAGPTEGSSNPIIDADVNVNPDSGTVEADVTVDTSGELEDKQIFDADLGAEDVTSVDTEVGSASEITGQEVVEGADITTSGQTDQTSDSTQVTTGETTIQETTNPPTTGGVQESSEPSSNPIVDVDTNVNPESGTVQADATIDTSGELEEKQILDADLTAGETTSTGAEVGSATDVTQSDTVESADITTQPVSTVTTTSDLTAEVDTTGATTGGEADVGIEADASGISEGEDVTCDPADGLTSAACGLPKL